MFNKEIRVNRKKDVRYGTTDIEPEETLSDILKLLNKHNCEKAGTMYQGDDIRIGFEMDGIPYIMDIPKVYIKDVYDPKIGIRIVYRYLETALELGKNRAVPLHNLLLSATQIRDPDDGKLKPMGDLWQKKLAEGKAHPEELLLGGQL